MEFCVNEIGGHFNNNTRNKYQFDFHKAMYGCMSIMWNIVQNFHFATITTFEELDIFFIHCKVNSIQLWPLKYHNEKFGMYRKKKIIVSNMFDDKSGTIHDVMCFYRTCKINFEQTFITLNKLKKEHKKFENLVLTGQADINSRKDLRDRIKMTVYKLTESNHSARLFAADPSIDW